MPNKFVFPGGRVDVADDRLRPPLDLHPDVLARLSKHCSRARARGLAMAAIRETFEEAGILLGEPDTATLKSRSPQWRRFLNHGVNPRLDTLQYIGRAITPPYRTTRFDARFFMAETELIQTAVETLAPTGELLEIHWVTVDEARKLELPRITQVIIDQVERRLRTKPNPADPGPFVRFIRGKPVVDWV